MDQNSGHGQRGLQIPGADAVAGALRSAWYPVARAQDLARQPVPVTLLGHDLVVFRTEDGTPAALDQRCPHRGAALDMGKVIEDRIACPYHGWQWRAADGRCALIPSMGPSGRIPTSAITKAYPARERFGLVWTCLDGEDGAPMFDPPELRGTDWEYKVGPVLEVSAGVRAATENFRDVAHFPFVHSRTLGDMDPEVEPLSPIREGHEVRLTRSFQGSGGDEMWRTSLEFEYHVIPPAYVCQQIRSTDGLRFLIHAPRPRSTEATVIYFVTGVAPGWSGMPISKILDYEHAVYLEDMPILERLSPPEAPLFGEPLEVHSPADRYTLEYRRAFSDWVADRGRTNVPGDLASEEPAAAH